MTRLGILSAVFALCAAAALPVRADNLATEWLDRVTHEVEAESGDLSNRPVDFHVYGGVYGYYTDNLFLDPTRHKDGDSALIGFGRARVDYSTSRVEAAAELLINYDFYSEHYLAREDQEHFYGKLRYADGFVDAQIVEIARRESDPISAQFDVKARRIVTDTIPRIGLNIQDRLKLEAYAQIETVWFEGSKYDSLENENFRVGLSALIQVNERFAVGAEGGYLRFHYRDSDISPGADGWFARAVARGELTSRLLVEVALGYSWVRTFREDAGPAPVQHDGSFDAEVHLRYELTENILLQGDYTRRFGFAGAGSSYQVSDHVGVLAEWHVFEPVKLRARGQYERVDPNEALVRTYWSVGAGANWQIIRHLSVDGSVTYRGGDTRGIAGDAYRNWVVGIGVILDF
ncbi:MAG: hypothetical protein K8T20_10400 [Planctomycetes bacterium]|nr:hypothetical protein [Planctomycetota bacterium]